MISLTYFSTANDEFTTEDLETLLRVSRLNNSALGLTGVLLYAGGHFVQTLEGEESYVDRVFEAIGRDPRHRDVLVAVREIVLARDFADWSMGFQRVGSQDAGSLPGFNDYLERGGEPVTGHQSHPRIFHRVFREQMLRLAGVEPSS